MSAPPESITQLPPEKKTPAQQLAERRADVDAKQAQVAALLLEQDCEALLLLEPENLSWITSGGQARSVLDPQQMPALYVSTDVRCLLASNLDAQRIFDEEIDNLGFQLKEWNWNWGREQLLTYLSRGRKLGCDVVRPDAKLVADPVRRLRYAVSEYEQQAYVRLGNVLTHALEATCRTMPPKQPEAEIAGHLAHRVLKHGAELVNVEITADDRSRTYRRPAFTSALINRHCVITATVRQFGLYATASRAVSFGAADANFKKEHDAACKITTSYISSSWPDAIPSAILQAGRRVYQINLYEHEWRASPAGWVTGRAAVEQLLTPQTTENLRPGWALTWRSSVGAAVSCDTFVVTAAGPLMITAPGNWPKKRIRISGANYDRPDILQR